MKLQNRIAIVTGASSGIGRATAVELARAGVHVALAARRQTALEGVAEECRALGVRAEAIPTDVSDREQCLSMIRQTEERLGPVDILVNNAGFALYDQIAEASLDDLEAMMATNYFGTVHCTQGVLPGMLARRRGAIVVMGSITGIMGFAGMGGYCATKFALTGFSEALRDEVIGQGITVSLVCPGTSDTEFFVKAERNKQPGASRLILAVPPERIARTVVRCVRRGTYRRVVPATAAAYMKLKELLPRTAHLLMRGVSGLIEGRNR